MARGEADSLGFWARTGAMGPMERDHAHADIELNFLFAGGVRYFFGGRFIALSPGRLAAFWAAIPHRSVEVDRGSEMGWVCVPLSDFLRYDLPSAALKRLLAGELVVDAAPDPEDPARLRRWSADWQEDDAYDQRTVRLEVEARLRRLLRDGGAPRPALPAGGPARRVEAIAAWLGEHYREDIALADVGRAVGLNPNYAMTVFRAGCGMSIWSYVTRLRLAHAQRLLATSGKTALAIAMDSGFGSLNRFYEASRTEFGMPPGAFRRRRR